MQRVQSLWRRIQKYINSVGGAQHSKQSHNHGEASRKSVHAATALTNGDRVADFL